MRWPWLRFHSTIENENDNDDEDDCFAQAGGTSIKSCSEQAIARRMGGRERLRPNRGSRPTLLQRVIPHKRTVAKCSAQKTLAEPITEYRTINEALVPFSTAGHLRGFMRFPRSAGKPRFGPSLSLPYEFASFV
jgi:hypothetical protein